MVYCSQVLLGRYSGWAQIGGRVHSLSRIRKGYTGCTDESNPSGGVTRIFLYLLRFVRRSRLRSVKRTTSGDNFCSNGSSSFTDESMYSLNFSLLLTTLISGSDYKDVLRDSVSLSMFSYRT